MQVHFERVDTKNFVELSWTGPSVAHTVWTRKLLLCVLNHGWTCFGCSQNSHGLDVDGQGSRVLCQQDNAAVR